MEENIVEVRLTEYEIDMPASLPEGVTDFLITNTGTAEHSFVMEGEGLEATLEANVRPGDTHQMRVDLQPGTYRVYCPVDDHSERGMALQLTVTVNDMDTGQAP